MLNSNSKVIVEVKNRIAYLTINSPKTLNALDVSLITELHTVLSSIQEDKEVRVIILTGQGEKAFVAGANIKEFSNFSEKEGRQLAKDGQDLLFNLIENFKKPIIAAINGYALGGGLELAMACHIRVAATNAKLGQPEVSLGLIPGYGGTQRLTQLVGKGHAMEMILTGAFISAEKALSIGLVNHTVLLDELLPMCEDIALKILKNSPFAITKSIEAINAVYGIDGFEKEINSFGECFGTSEFKEGVSAFLEKRKPNF